MMNRRYMGAAMVAIGVIAAPAQAITRTEIATMIKDIDDHFVCPEALATDAERQASVTAFSHQLAARHIAYTQAKTIMGFMLTRHGCRTVMAEPTPVAAQAPMPVEATPVTIAAADPQ
jgi:hypothetical protein